ncbi:phosphopantetheine-binding protein [Paractinoplanes toevensis]|uniref:Carrier domain-containing protein n=1 Tax=Paractinoplanes toevensis TaxID=571911 RepID=A0A919W689_9ACTN|nr:phosphopantetheine-binding protein [Actinoplanes toevensis]GIM92598.1 hypothetical protein Ato02nite_043910 [Actinoplanes toevensis]
MTAHTVSRADINRILEVNIGLEPDVIADAGSASLTDLGVDSIGIIELEKVLLDEFGIVLPDEIPAMSIADVLAHAQKTKEEV